LTWLRIEGSKLTVYVKYLRFAALFQMSARQMSERQDSYDLYVIKCTREEIDNETNKGYTYLLDLETQKHTCETKISEILAEVEFIQSGINVQTSHLHGLAESLRKIGREMPQSPYSTPAGQHDTCDASMTTVAAGCDRARSDTAPNPYLIADRPGP